MGNRTITTMKVKKRKLISKEEITRLVKPSGDFFMEKTDAWTYKLHLTPKDAVRYYPALARKFEVESAGKGYYGACYIVRHQL